MWRIIAYVCGVNVLRLLAALVWLLTSALSVGASAAACEPSMMMDDHGGHVGMAMENGAMSDRPLVDDHHDGDEDCSSDCCEGLCLCDGLAAPIAALPVASATTTPPTGDDGFAAVCDGVAGRDTALEGPPPRLL